MEPLIGQIVIRVNFGNPSDPGLQLFFRMVEIPRHLRITFDLSDLRRTVMSVKSKSRRVSPEPAQNHDPHLREIITERPENRSMKGMFPLNNPQVKMFPDLFKNLTVGN